MLLSYALDQGTEIQAKIAHSRSPDIVAKISGNSLDHPYQFRDRFCAHFLHDLAAMDPGGDVADVDLSGYLLVRLACRGQRHHLPFSSGKGSKIL